MSKPPRVDRVGPRARTHRESMEALYTIGNVLIWTLIGALVVAVYLGAMAA